MNRRGAETQRREEDFSASLRRCGSNDWLLWQLADSAFPTGGFAHSGGLEAACQHGELRGHELTAYLQTAVRQVAHNSMPFVHAVFSESHPFDEVDRTCDAFLSNHVANRASRLQGQAFLASVEKTFRSSELSSFRSEVAARGSPTHFAPVFGTLARLLLLEAIETARLFVFMQLRGWISAAVRLNIVGPLEGQSVQHQLADITEAAALQFGAVALADVAQTAPLLDLWQATQDRLYSRLFQS